MTQAAPTRVLTQNDTADIMSIELSRNIKPASAPFAGHSNAGNNEIRVWMFFDQTIWVERIDKAGNPTKPERQNYELEVALLRDGEFVQLDDGDEDDPRMIVRLKGRFSRFRFGRCHNVVDFNDTPRGNMGLYFREGFADERIDWIAANTTGAWSLTVTQPELPNGNRFGLQFSFSSERDATLFKMFWQ